MGRALAYEAQCREQGGLPSDLRRSLKLNAVGKQVPPPDRSSLAPTLPAFVSKSVAGVATAEIGAARKALQDLTGTPEEAETCRAQILELVARADLAPGEIRILLDATRTADLLGIPADRLKQDALTITAAFRHRRRGVETRLVLADALPARDEVLLRNVALGHSWFGKIKAGQTYEDISTTAGVSGRRVMQLVDLAFLAPDIIGRILEGRQPTGLTSDHLIKRGFPDNWEDQRKAFAAL